MTRPTTYRVLIRDDRWILKRDGHDEAAAWSMEKDEMIERGAETCDSLRPSRLYIHQRDGDVDEIRTYPATTLAEYSRLQGGPAL